LINMLEILRQPSTPRLRAIGFATLACVAAGAAGVALTFLSYLIGRELDLGRAALASLLAGLLVAALWLLPQMALPLWRLALHVTAAPELTVRREPLWETPP
jgi:hypothetical protein